MANRDGLRVDEEDGRFFVRSDLFFSTIFPISGGGGVSSEQIAVSFVRERLLIDRPLGRVTLAAGLSPIGKSIRRCRADNPFVGSSVPNKHCKASSVRSPSVFAIVIVIDADFDNPWPSITIDDEMINRYS
jgi:hypothetical protein